MATTPVLTYIVPGGNPALTIWASVITASPASTVLALACAPFEEPCDVPEQNITMGPWALPSPPASASTGVWDRTVFGRPPGQPVETYVEHCAMTRYTVPASCTTYDSDPKAEDDRATGLPAATFTSPSTDDD